MSEWLREKWAHVTWTQVLYGALLFVGTFVVTTAIVFFIVVKLPADYFSPRNRRKFMARWNPAARWAAIAGKNVLGLALVAAGVVLSLPGVPGPGLVTILLGVMLLDFPGKRKLQLKIVRQKNVRRELDRIRKKFGKQPFELD
ncbi:MAG: hypothetical protein LC746_18945 [Acidobacteria bacterium]|nr:hypothetical protein [Acidobacteriota bacterium]